MTPDKHGERAKITDVQWDYILSNKVDSEPLGFLAQAGRLVFVKLP
jgi:hypothetical protein